ncbi:hypothetical protein M404DRAFT_1005864 [Pisolithus tinctorius Marx 270]|uniref:Uncharacterized protein n=1 Tax=Pisolithus tinctorius Marx 270 TaxID=870435 RepID=A0A0C3IL25_PISTI|nr:hypothetical protein M404DRAFT_1005864 [Pisolithus tinctorius Marx 270]
MPKHKEKLFYGGSTNQSPTKYPRLSKEDTLANWGTRWGGQRQYDWDLEDGGEYTLCIDPESRITLGRVRNRDDALYFSDASSDTTVYRRSRLTETAPSLEEE